MDRWQLSKPHHHCTFCSRQPLTISNVRPQSWCLGARRSHQKVYTEDSVLTSGIQNPIGPHLLRAYAPSSNHRLLPQPSSTEQRTTDTRIARSISCPESRLRQRRRLASLYTPILYTRQHLLKDWLATPDSNTCSVQQTSLDLSSRRIATPNL